MKKFLYLTLFLIYPFLSLAQNQKRFTAIDTRAKSIGYLPLQELTKKLTAPYSDEEDKTRSIFTWIAYHISYDEKELEHRDSLRYDKHKYALIQDEAVFDSLWNNEYAAFVLKNHRGICGEYAALFKVICDLAHLKCEVVEGYGKWPEFIGNPYTSNHAWNVVSINNKWQLMDVTWASGGRERKHGKVNNGLDYFYYCTPPELFINNHYPDKIKWNLLDKLTSRNEFEKAIYCNYEGQNKIKIGSTIPKIGFLKKKVGDSISFEMITNSNITSIGLTLNDTIEEINYQPFPDTTKSDKQVSKSIAIKADASKKVKAINDPLEIKAIDDIFNYIDTASIDTVDFASYNKIYIPVSADNQSGIQSSDDVQYFKRNGDEISFKYYIKKKGDFLIWVYMNDEPIMAYRLQVE
jgi:hypothetical protein